MRCLFLTAVVNSYGFFFSCVLAAYYVLDELIIGGHMQEANKRELLRIIAAQDERMAEATEGAVRAKR